MRPRVVVTGIGAVSAAGLDAASLAQAVEEGRRCFTALADEKTKKLRATHAGLIDGLTPHPEDPPQVQVLDRNVHLALRAMREAIAKSGLGPRPLGSRTGVVMGTCSGGMLSIEKHYAALVGGHDPLDADLYFSKQYYTAAKVLAWAAGAGGPALSVITACAAGAGAIAQGADLIRAGLADVILAGGSDTFALSTLAGFDALKATCENICTPFSSTIGLNLGEGAAFWVLENLAYAKARNAKPLAELLGSGLSNDAYHATAPDPSTKGQTAAMLRALKDAGTTAEAIDYINTHGTGTRANDPIESRAIAKLLQNRVDAVPVSSTKSIIGHCLGGAGALEASAVVLAAQRGVFPATAGFDRPREGCALPDYLPDPGRPWQGRVALSNNFGFGGNNACLLLDVNPDTHTQTHSRKVPAVGKVVVSGIGVVSPYGAGIQPLLQQNHCAATATRRWGLPVEPFPLAVVPEIDSRDIDRRLDLRGMDRCSQYATLATRLALKEAGLRPRPSAMAEVGMVLGQATGPSQGETEHLTAVFEGDFEISRLGAFPYVVPNETAGHVSRAMLLKGHNTVVTAGCGSGIAALLSAAIAVEQGHGETIIGAATDELTERTVSDGYTMGRWGPSTGVVPGEGAAAFVIEPEQRVAQRSAQPIAEIVGYGWTTDVADPRQRSGTALVSALQNAMARGNVGPEDIDAVALGGPLEKPDGTELKAIRTALLGPQTPVISLADKLGFAEATLSLFNLTHQIYQSRNGALIAATALSPEGFASAILLRCCRR